MVKKKEEVKKEKPTDIERKNVLVGVVGMSQLDVLIQADKSIWLNETFLDPNYEMTKPFDKRPPIFNLCMHIRPEYVPQLLRILQENGFDAAGEPMPLPPYV